jgi:DNA-directed RNA polymerase subunit RPC12/RpoP
MPEITYYRCEKCGLKVYEGTGVNYVLQDGERVWCPHPGEDGQCYAMTGMTLGAAMRQGIAGFLTDCRCMDCGEKADLDLERDEKKCPKCSSTRIASFWDCHTGQCPRCGAPGMNEHSTGCVS